MERKKEGRKRKEWLKMAHKEKVYKGAVGHMLGHYDRSKEVPELACPANTVLNYNLAVMTSRKISLTFFIND